MVDVVILKLNRFNYISKLVKTPDNISFDNIKKYVYENYGHMIYMDDIVVWIYAGKIVTDITDLTSIVNPICCYILTEVIKGNSYTNLFTNIFNNVINEQNSNENFMYRTQMLQMLDMGFPNEDYVRDALILSEGRLDDAIMMYMNFTN
jgi:hypothetical protein